MITIELEGKPVEQRELTHHYQDDPYPGGLVFTIKLSGQDKDKFHKRFRPGVEDLTQRFSQGRLFEWLVLCERSPGSSRYVLNKVISVEITDSDVILVLAASPLVSLSDFHAGRTVEAG